MLGRLLGQGNRTTAWSGTERVATSIWQSDRALHTLALTRALMKEKADVNSRGFTGQRKAFVRVEKEKKEKSDEEKEQRKAERLEREVRSLASGFRP